MAPRAAADAGETGAAARSPCPHEERALRVRKEAVAITLRQIEYFVAVAETGSVTAAARQLYLSQSTVSIAVTELEKALAVSLFVRHPRGLVLTREGTAVLGRAQRLLRDAVDLEAHAASMASEMSGTLTIGCYSTIATMLLPRMVAQFAEEHPAVDLRFLDGPRGDLLEGLPRGRFDALVLYDYTFTDDLDGVGDTTVLGSIKPYALLPPRHPLAGTGPVRLEDLAADPLILLGLEPADQYFLSLFDARGLKPSIRYRSRNFEVVRGLVARGMGYSLLTQRTLQTSSAEGLPYAAAELEGDFRPLDVVALTPGRTGTTRRVLTFIEMARQAYLDSPQY